MGVNSWTAGLENIEGFYYDNNGHKIVSEPVLWKIAHITMP